MEERGPTEIVVEPGGRYSALLGLCSFWVHFRFAEAEAASFESFLFRPVRGSAFADTLWNVFCLFVLCRSVWLKYNLAFSTLHWLAGSLPEDKHKVRCQKASAKQKSSVPSCRQDSFLRIFFKAEQENF